MKRFLQIPYYSFVALVMAMGVLLLATLMPIPGNFSVKIVKSGSMEPTIKTGGIVVLRPSESYGVGDVVTFGKDTKTQIPTTHRIIEAKDGAFLTKGDANDSPDPLPIQKSDIRGKVIFSAPYLGFMLDFAKKPLGFMLIVGIPALLVIIDEIGNIWREVRKIRSKKNLRETRENEKPPTLERRIFRNSNILDLRPKIRIAEEVYSYNHANLLFFLIGLASLALGLSSVKSTVSYYNETELASGNTLMARAIYPNQETTTPGEILSASIEIETNSENAPLKEEIEEVIDEVEEVEEVVETAEITEGEDVVAEETEEEPTAETVEEEEIVEEAPVVVEEESQAVEETAVTQEIPETEVEVVE